MKRSLLLALTFFILFAPLYTEEDDVLKLEASISPRRLSKGEEGKVVLKFLLQKGITIIPQPSFTIELNPSEELIFPKNFFTSSDLEIEIFEENGDEYLNLEGPIEIPFTVSLKAQRGNHTFEGRVKYFANSEEEGWCLKSSAKFSASFYTRNSVVSKKKQSI